MAALVYGELVNQNVVATRDFHTAPKKGMKRKVKLAEGTKAICFEVFQTKYEAADGVPQEVARLQLADGTVMTVSPKGLKAVGKVKDTAKLDKLRTKLESDRAEGSKLVAFMSDTFDVTGKVAYVRFGNEGRQVPASQVTATETDDGFLVTMPVWLIERKFAKVAADILKVAKPVEKVGKRK